jgi:di/tricarboxylate transporter
MSPAVASLVALVIAIVLSMVSRINVGLVSIGFAWVIGVYMAGFRPEEVMAGFPVTLFITLVGVTLLFSIAETNGTLERLAHRAVRQTRGSTRVIPVLFFILAMVLSSVGPGALSTVALLAPLAMAVGHRAGVPHFLTALMVCNGANAGNLSPISAIGVIANQKMAEAGVGGHEAKVFLTNLAAHVLVAGAAYFLLGGHRLPARTVDPDIAPVEVTLEGRHRLTTALILLWIVGVTGLKLSVGFSAFAISVILVLANVAEENRSIRQIPWGAILMVSGVSVLIALLEKTGGMDLFTTLLAKLASPSLVNGMIAFVTGAISTYSSTSGVVLPTFLPTVPGLIEKVGGGDPLAVSLSINVGSALVDVSPLSTSGALCVAAVADPAAARTLFQRLLAWGLSMTVVGAILSQLFAGMIARW